MKEYLLTLKKSEGFKIFMEEVRGKKGEWESILRDAEEVLKVYRAQGAIQAFEFVEGLIDALIDEYESKDEEEELGI